MFWTRWISTLKSNTLLILDRSITSTVLFCGGWYGLILCHHRYQTSRAKLMGSRRHDPSRFSGCVPRSTNVKFSLHIHKSSGRHYPLYSNSVLSPFSLPRHYKTRQSIGPCVSKYGHHCLHSCERRSQRP